MRKAMVAAAVAALGLTGGRAMGAISFQGLGIPYGDNSQAYAVSADGSVVVGESGNNSQGQAFRWSRSGGMQLLGDLPGGNINSRANGVSGDGSVVVGVGVASDGAHAFRWTAAGGLAALADLPGGKDGTAHAASGDGMLIVGSDVIDRTGEAFAVTWDFRGQITSLGHLPGGGISSAYAVSKDGDTIAGIADDSPNSLIATTHAFRWTTPTGMVQLDTGDAPKTNYSVSGISGDGSLVAGTRQTPWTGFVWGPGGVKLALVDHGIQGISGDGSVVVGQSDDGAYFWTSQTGIVVLKDFLEQNTEMDLTGWDFSTVGGISADGTTIVGSGTDPFGLNEAWIAVIPEPSALIVSAGVIGGLLLRVRRRG